MARPGSYTMEEKDFRLVFDEYKHRVYGYVLAIIHSHEIAEEITQEVFIKIWLSGDLMANVNNPEAYIFTIARNRSINFLRKAAFDQKIIKELEAKMNPISADMADEKLLEEEYKNLLRQAIDQLSPQRKKVYELSRQNGFSLDEIAAELKISRNTAKNHLVEALKQIRDHLSSYGSAGILVFFLLYS